MIFILNPKVLWILWKITDFPIRDHKVILVLRRCLDIRTGKSFSLPLKIDLTASGTRYSKKFSAFLKETTASSLSHSLKMIFAKNTIKDAARLSLAKWYNKVEEVGFYSFNVIAATFYEYYEDILNFYNNRPSNAVAESFNAKIKLFRANIRGVADKKFFLYRNSKLCA